MLIFIVVFTFCVFGTSKREQLVQVAHAWPPNHEVVSSSLEGSHFVNNMSNVRFVPNLSPPRHPLMSTNWAYFLCLEQLSCLIIGHTTSKN